MTEGLTGSELMAIVGFFVMLAGTGWGIWWKIDGRIKDGEKATGERLRTAEERADRTSADLASYKLHVAETFATKASQAEQTAQLLRAIEGVGNRIDGVHERLDRLYENQPARRTTARG
jgi:hypothetical protein